MSFSENIKLQVKEKAAFRCCRCQNIGIDVHHITPEKDDGLDDISNAAPLCQNCHDQFGDNPSKRKEMVQMRDWWYKKCEIKYSAQDVMLMREMVSKLEEIKHGSQSGINELKQILRNIHNKTTDKVIDKLSRETADATASAIVNSIDAIELSQKPFFYVYYLEEDYSYQTSMKGRNFKNKWFTLEEDGKMTIKKGYVWDGCPPKYKIRDLYIGLQEGCINFETGKSKTYYASLVHDVFYQFSVDIRSLVSRGDVDYEFYLLLKRDKFTFAALYYFNVRLFGWVWWNRN
ncbi:MAG: HNH endonuclease signature motif containing protein [Candidatus Omnitrophica bacterium]|nr:HNH endonuclease signature motif containing protein [Candidatus Omnitrophota bacterium]